MPTDQEYLEMAGVSDSATTESPSSSQAPTPQEGAEPTAQQKLEMFELSGQKFPVNTEFQFIEDGKTQKVPYSQLLNGYRRATHLQKKWESDYKPKIDQFESARPEFEKYKGFYEKYNGLQSWSEQHPEDWKRLEEIWQNKDQHLLASRAGIAANGQPQQAPHLDPIIKELADLKNKYSSEVLPLIDSMRSQEAQKQQDEDVKYITNQVTEFQKEFPEVDLNEKDPDGVSLWAKIVQWGNTNGYVEFTPAAMMYLKPRIAEVYGLRARQEAMKSVKTDHQNGIVKRSTSPIQGQGAATQNRNVRKMSYAELAEQAKGGLANAS